MKKIIFGLTSIALAMLLGACANSASTAEQAAAASCGNVAPTSSPQTLAGACRVSSGEERVLIEGLSLPANGNSVSVVFKTDDASSTSPTTGIKIDLIRNTNDLRLTATNTPNSTNNCTRVISTGSIPSKVCVELHEESGDAHIIAYVGSDCDNTFNGDNAGIVFNTEDSQTAGDTTTCSGNMASPNNNGGAYPTGSKVTFFASGGTMSKLSTTVKKTSNL
jgi:hypothetical protein